MSFNTLNDQLAHASKKFVRACDQIKILKQRIAELVTMFSYCDPGISSSNNMNQSTNQFENLINNTAINSLNHTNLSDSSINCFNVNIFKESIRQQIENLQSVKTAYFMYAHKKADEITRLQCELYGEDAVRVAYENAPPDILIPASTDTNTDDNNQTSTNESNTNTNQINEYNNNNNNNVNDEIDQTHANTNEIAVSESNYWTPWDFNNTNDDNSETVNYQLPDPQMGDHLQYRRLSQSQVQLIEYDFLTA